MIASKTAAFPILRVDPIPAAGMRRASQPARRGCRQPALLPDRSPAAGVSNRRARWMPAARGEGREVADGRCEGAGRARAGRRRCCISVLRPAGHSNRQGA